MNCGHLSAQKRRRSGSGWRWNAKPGGSSASPLVIGQRRRVGRCGNHCRPVIGNVPCCTAISGRATPRSYPQNGSIRSAKIPAKRAILNGSTIRFANIVPTWFGSPSLLVKIAKNMNVGSDYLLIMIMQHYQSKFNHYHLQNNV